MPTQRALRRALAALLMTTLPAAAMQAPPPPQARFDFDRTPGHLPRTVLAPHQALVLDLDPALDRFDGESTLTLTVRQPLPSLLLHAHQLTARRSVLVTATGERPLTVQPDERAQTWRLVPTDGRPVPAGRATLKLAWSGVVQTTGSGLFSSVGTSQGGPRRMLATQLQAIYARTVFPSFDEPAFRTRFDLTVRTPPGHEVLSNMPPVHTATQGGRVVHRFATTPPMPSYLVAVAVGRFDALSGRAAGVPLRILTAPGKRDQGGYALAATQQILPFYGRYFGTPFALPKLDQLAVPSGRDGAMEDWGLISYAESALLFDPATDNSGDQRGIFNIVAHELAHQWFGNLVTAASWQEIWLNEAFAEWMADKATDRFNPAWQMRLRGRRGVDQTMERDAGTATRAIRSGAVPEDRVPDVFDDITYTKGGAVLGMLEAWIGEDTFRRGLAAYMKERRMSNATAGDLWFHIGRASGRDVAAVAASWTDQPGFPVVDVDSRCEAGRTHVSLAQRPFSLDGTPRVGRWQIPLVLNHGGRAHRLLLKDDRQILTLPGCPPQPLVLNPQGVGFYRVAYAPPAQAALTAAFLQLPPAAQITLLSDRFALAQAGVLPMTDWLDLVALLPRTQGPGRPALLSQAQAGLRLLDEALRGSAAASPLAAATRALLGPELQALGWDARPGEDSEAELLRRGLIRDLAQVGDAAVLARAGALFDDDEAGRHPLPAPIRSAVIGAAGWTADAARFDALQRRLLKAASEADQWLFAQALARVPDATLAGQVLALSLGDALPHNLSTRLPGMLGGARRHREAAYQHVVDHWAVLSERSGGMFGSRAWLLPGVAWGANEAPLAQRLLDDQQRLAGAPGSATAQQVAARITLLAAIRQREAARLVPALEALAAGR